MIHRARAQIFVTDWFVLATLPCALFGLWNTGRIANEAASPELLASLPLHLSALTTGAKIFLPTLLFAVATSLFWSLGFAVLRRRALDPAWLMSAWLFALLIPHGVPPLGVVAGVSFGVVFGQCIFGGTGRYLVSPALLGVLFLQLSYPGWFDAEAWSIAQGDWGLAFIGVEQGPLGTTSELLCVLGAAVLFIKGAASWRVAAGAVIGASAMAWLIDSSLPWYGHLLLGQFAFCVAFVAMDPSVAAASRPGRWIYGGLAGVLTVLFRVVDPAQPEGTLLACLTAALFAPLIDTCVVRAQIFRYRRRALP